MSKIKVLVHVGQPKCCSTSIQNTLIGSPNINYLGFYPKFEKDGFYMQGIGNVFELSLRFETNYLFSRNFLKYKNSLMQKLAKNKLNIISCEALTFKCYPNEIDTDEKLRRLATLLDGLDVTILYLWRTPSKLLKSYYNELVKLGLSINFDKFIDISFKFRKTNFIQDLCGKKTSETIKYFFEKAHVLSIEFSKDNPYASSQLLELLRKFTDCKSLTLPHHNKSFSDSYVESIRQTNSKQQEHYPESLISTQRMFPSLAINQSSWVWNKSHSLDSKPEYEFSNDCSAQRNFSKKTKRILKVFDSVLNPPASSYL